MVSGIRSMLRGGGKNLIANKQVSEPFVDVTNEYLQNATPNVGNIEFDNNFVPTNYPEEVSFANWIHKALGGNIKILAETKTSKMADDIVNITLHNSLKNFEDIGHWNKYPRSVAKWIFIPMRRTGR